MNKRNPFFISDDDDFVSTATNINRKIFKKEIESRYPLPEKGISTTIFYTPRNTLLAIGYNRVVYGDRGAYIEFERRHIKAHLINKFENSDPPDEIYYDWMTPNDSSGVKVYRQRRHVTYADYKIGKLYVSPKELIIKTWYPQHPSK
jgi:hypothetical protein